MEAKRKKTTTTMRTLVATYFVNHGLDFIITYAWNYSSAIPDINKFLEEFHLPLILCNRREVPDVPNSHST